jgi:hypothetical protein
MKNNLKILLFQILLLVFSCNTISNKQIKRFKESEVKEESKNFWVEIKTGEPLTGIVYRKEGNNDGDTTTYERTFKNGKILTLKSFNKDGSLAGEIFYENDLISRSWHGNGTYKTEQTYKNGRLLIEKNYNDGKLESTYNGNYKLFYNPDGSKKNGTFIDSSYGHELGRIHVEKYKNGKFLFDTIYSNRR